MAKDPTLMDRVVNLCKRRGFVFPTAEIYGGLGGFWDWGPLGQKLKDNIKKAWWRDFVLMWDDVVGIDGAIITNPKVWEASGHVQNMVDLLVECKRCHHRFKGDEIKDECPDCGGELTEPRRFNIMFRTTIGPVEDTASTAYLRGETCQNIFVNYENVRETMRLKLPFGIAQIGKAFRNEITPGNFVFRSREFEQMELEFFVRPDKAEELFKEWVDRCERWLLDHGLKEKNLRRYEQKRDELAHYARRAVDLQYAFPIEKGWAELWGIANRGDYDLRQHGKMARGDEQAFATPIDDDSQTKIVPFVIEPSLGVERAALAFLLDAYDVVEGGRTTTTTSNKEEEVVLRLHPSLAPVKVAVLPLSKKPELIKIAHSITHDLRRHWTTMYDDGGSIGRRYRRQDEIGTPHCITVDFDTIEGGKRAIGTVTVRDRDTMAQDSIAIDDLVDYFRGKLG
jgi:glycyl-tRNA synthetase